MILDNMSMPVKGDTSHSESKDCNDTDKSTSSVAMTTATMIKTEMMEQPSNPTSSVSAINPNTFVVKLKPSPSITNGHSSSQGKTNLLEIFGESKGKNISVVKALGRIVINRTLLKNSKNKPTSASLPISSQETISVNNSHASSKAAPIIFRGFNKENKDGDKKDDDISGNLANFMNFKLTGLVPSPIKNQFSTSNTFQVKLNAPEIKLSEVKQSEKSSSKSKQASAVTSPSVNPQTPESPKSVDDSDDLTSLSWLTGNDKNLLKTIRSCNPDDAGISLSDEESEEEEEDEGNSKSNAIFTAKSRVDSGNQGGFSTRQYGQTSYNPNGKPPYSFSCLIFMAVEDSPRKMLPVKEIYAWVCKHFPYFQTAPSGWKNSIRHNLSLNKCFKKVEQDKHLNDPGKGSLWCIDPAYRPNLIQALKRTPFYPYLYSNGIGQPLSLHNLANLLPGVRAGRVPLWSPSLTQPTNSACADPDVASAAMNLIELMKGNDSIDRKSAASVESTLKELTAEIFCRNQDEISRIPLVITDPADDHTYSNLTFSKVKTDTSNDRCLTPDSEKSAPDAAYEFETCGTDLDSDDNLSVESEEEEECDLADSGFAGLKKRGGTTAARRKRRATRSPSPVEKGAKKPRSSPRNSTKSTQTPTKRALKVRFQHKKKEKKPSPKISRKRKFTPQEGDGVLTSDVDSGKDSPKVVTKSRKRTPARKTVTRIKKKKSNIPKPPPTVSHTSPYGTRSSSKKTRQSRRDQKGNALQRAAARKRKQDSVSAESDDEEIKLAAGSLLHLAGFRASN